MRLLPSLNSYKNAVGSAEKLTYAAAVLKCFRSDMLSNLMFGELGDDDVDEELTEVILALADIERAAINLDRCARKIIRNT